MFKYVIAVDGKGACEGGGVVSERPHGQMVVLAGLEVLGSIQILHNHSLGMGLMVRGDGWEGGLMRGWGVVLDCGIRECSNII